MRRILYILILFVMALPGNAQSLQDQLDQADSLFGQEKYTEAYEVYHSLMKDHNRYSPAMLLRMAYIKEGLQQFDEALYYLNLYYLRTADENVLEKMEKLADEHRLAGYDFNDWEFFKTIFYRYFNYITALLIALALLFLALQIRARMKKRHPAKGYALGMVLVLAVLFYTLNFGLKYDRAVVMDENTYLMSGPSAASEVKRVIGKGHRLPLNGEKDVWIETEWDNETVYIKANKLQPVTF